MAERVQSNDGQPGVYSVDHSTLIDGKGVALRLDVNGNVMARSVTGSLTPNGSGLPESKDGQLAVYFATWVGLSDGKGYSLPVDQDGYLLIDTSADASPVSASAVKQTRDGRPSIYNNSKKVQLSDGESCALQLTSLGAVRATTVA